jgi:hypothetical protein
MLHCHFNYHESNTESQEIEPGAPRWKSASNCLSYGTVPLGTVPLIHKSFHISELKSNF